MRRRIRQRGSHLLGLLDDDRGGGRRRLRRAGTWIAVPPSEVQAVTLVTFGERYTVVTCLLQSSDR